MLSTISSWILSIAGIICISVIVELIMPNGQMNRYIKGIFSFIIILVIIMPIPKLLKLDLDLSKAFNTENVKVQEDYLYQLNLDKVMAAKEGAENEIKSKGYNNVIVSINADIFAQKVEFKSITVDISNLVITDKAEHKNIVDIRYDIVKVVQTYVKIEEGKIYFNE